MTTYQIQLLLLYLGYETVGAADGLDGPDTQAGVKAFQKEYGGLTVDSVAGSQTGKALRKAVADGWERP